MSSQEPAGEAGAVLRFAIVIEKARNNYSAYVPDLPGCVATGDSVEETEKLIREAIDFHLEGMREDSAPRAASEGTFRPVMMSGRQSSRKAWLLPETVP